MGSQRTIYVRYFGGSAGKRIRRRLLQEVSRNDLTVPFLHSGFETMEVSRASGSNQAQGNEELNTEFGRRKGIIQFW
jgi:hypothetical protein